jgi:excisionase family DNA binding protein
MTATAARIASRWLTFEEAKTALKMGDDKVRKLLAQGDIYGKKIGKEWRVDAESITALLNTDRDQIRVAVSRLRK